MKNKNCYIPAGKKCVLLICTDFELAWAWRFSKIYRNSKIVAERRAEIERQNIPLILELADTFQIPLTFATVGHLALEMCDSDNGNYHPDVLQIQPFNDNYWEYNEGWYNYDTCRNPETSKFYKSLDLIEQILSSNVKHELGCHTFSHINCNEKVCSPQVFKSEVMKCKEMFAKLGIELRSFVFPGNVLGHTNLLKEFGFTSYRDGNNDILGYPKQISREFWEIKSTSQIVFRNYWSLDYNIRYYLKIIKKAMKTNTVCYLWFHPSHREQEFFTILSAIFEYVNNERENIYITTTGDYINWLNNNV
ncbi:MAG: polysaccharide deacetylase [Ignavibacteria bacterium]